MAYLLPKNNIITAKETAELVLKKMVRLLGVPFEMVSNRGLIRLLCTAGP